MKLTSISSALSFEQRKIAKPFVELMSEHRRRASEQGSKLRERIYKLINNRYLCNKSCGKQNYKFQ